MTKRQLTIAALILYLPLVTCACNKTDQSVEQGVVVIQDEDIELDDLIQESIRKEREIAESIRESSRAERKRLREESQKRLLEESLRQMTETREQQTIEYEQNGYHVVETENTAEQTLDTTRQTTEIVEAEETLEEETDPIANRPKKKWVEDVEITEEPTTKSASANSKRANEAMYQQQYEEKMRKLESLFN